VPALNIEKITREKKQEQGIFTPNSILNRLKNVSIHPSKFLVGLFMMVYAFITFKICKLAVSKLSIFTSHSNALNILKNKLADILRLTNNYFIIFITHIFRSKGLELGN